MMGHLDHHKVLANHVVNFAYRRFALTTSVVPLTIRPLNVITKILASTLNGLSMLFLVPSAIYNLQCVGQSNNIRAFMNRHKSDFRFYAAGKINKMDNKLLYDHLICHYIDYLHVSIVDMIHVGNNTESQLDELLDRKERKWIWDLCSITPYGLNQDDGYCCQNKRCRKR